MGRSRVADLDINGDHVLVRGVRSSNEVSVTNARSVAVIDTHAFRVWMQNAHDVLFRGGSYGGNTNTPTVQIAGDPASSALTFDGVDFHDAVATNSTVHMECIWVAGVDGFTVRNSIFRNCAYFDIFFTRLNGPDPKNVLLENNVFEVTKQWNGQNAPYAVNVANWLSQAQNFHFRNNSFGGDIAIQPTTIANMKLSGNIGAVASCKSGVRLLAQRLHERQVLGHRQAGGRRHEPVRRPGRARLATARRAPRRSTRPTPRTPRRPTATGSAATARPTRAPTSTAAGAVRRPTARRRPCRVRPRRWAASSRWR